MTVEVKRQARKPVSEKSKIRRELTLKPEIRKTAKQRPRVLITIRIKPRVKKVTGKSKILRIGLRINSKMASIRATLIIVSIFGEKLKFDQISFSITRPKAKNKVYLSSFFMSKIGNYYTAYR